MTADGAHAAGENGSRRPASFLRRVLGGTFNYGLGAVLPKAIGFLLLPVYAAFLTPEDFGVLDIAAGLAGLLTVAMRLGVPGAIARFYYDYSEGEELRDYVTTVAWFMFVVSLVVGAVTVLTSPWVVESLLPGMSTVPYVVLVVLAAVFAGNWDLERRLIQAREQSSLSVKLNAARGLITTCLSVVFVAGCKWGAMGMLLAAALASQFFFLQAVWYLRRDLRGRFRWEKIRGSMGYAMGVLPSHLVGNIAPLASRAILANLGSLSAVGLVGMANRFVLPFTVVQNAFSTAYLPIYFSLRKDGGSSARLRVVETARITWSTAVCVGLLLSLGGPNAVVLLTPERFHPSADVLPVLVIGIVFQSLFTVVGTELYYSKKTGYVGLVAIVSTTVTLLATFLLAEDYGAIGLAWAMTAGAISNALLSIVFAQMLERIEHRWWIFARNGIVGTVIYYVAFVLQPTNPLLALGAAMLWGLFYLTVLHVLGDPSPAALARRLGGLLRPSKTRD